MNLAKIRFSELKNQTGEIETSFRDVFCFVLIGKLNM